MKIIFMGTPDFSVPTLKALIDQGHEVLAVFTQPPRPAGRGHKVQLSPVHQLAEEYYIPVHCPVSLKRDNEAVVTLLKQADVVVVVAYGLLLPGVLLEAPKHGCLNIHASLLPRWRGAAPIQRAIEAGDAETGVTIMQMNEGMDTGDMVAVERCDIGAHTTGQLLHDSLSCMGADLLIEVLKQGGAWQKTPQPLDGVTYAAKLTKPESCIDWSKSAVEIAQKIRAFTPWPGAYFECHEEKIRVFSYELVEGCSDVVMGEVVDDRLTICCGEKTLLRPTKIQRPGKKMADTEAVLRGFSIEKGTQL